MIDSIVSRYRIVEVYELVYDRHKTDEQRFKDIQQRTGAGLGCIERTMGEYHETGKE